jgi:hypothetical protein
MAGLVAQESAPPPQKTAASVTPKPLIPLKITVVISRWQGDKKTASLPFTLSVNSDDRNGTSLRMSEDTPVPQGAMSAPNVPVASYSYRQIGTNIDATAQTLEDNRFSLTLAIQDSQVLSDAAKPSGLPSFQSFSSTMHIIVKDGQTAQYTTATDKISGEVVKVDVTLNVIH